MTKLSQAALAMLSAAGCSEVSDDYLVMGSTDVRVLLSARAVRDLNAQARGDDVDPAPAAPTPAVAARPALSHPAEPAEQDAYLTGIMNRR